MKDNIEELVEDIKCEYKHKTLKQDYQMSLKYCSKCDGYDYECIYYKPSLDYKNTSEIKR
jgi:hypothetical protein